MGSRQRKVHKAPITADDQTAANHSTTTPSLSRQRLWFFRLVAVVIIPCLLIVLTELGLHAVGYGYNPNAIIPCDLHGQPGLQHNNAFSTLFFSPALAREFTPFVVAEQKPKETIRIFVLGASAVRGEPDFAYSFSRILNVLLSKRHPDRHFEVINLGMAAINSHAVVEIAKSVVKANPDLIVVYLGNNEVVGPYGAGTVFAPLSRHHALIRLGIQLRHTKWGQLITNLSQSLQGNDMLKQWGGLSMFMDKQVTADSEELQIVYTNFRDNLETIAQLTGRRNIPLILSTVATNLKDCPPFMSQHRSDMSETEKDQFDRTYQTLVQQESSQADRQELLDQYLQLVESDRHFAELHFRIARLAEQLQQYDRAKEHYLQARQWDTLRLRADDQINNIIRETALAPKFNNINLLDTAQELQAASPHELPGKHFFYEHVHLNFQGNYQVAKTLLGPVENILKSQSLISNSSAPLSSVQDCRTRLGFTPWNQHQTLNIVLEGFIQRPPFTTQAYHQKQVAQFEQTLRQLQDSLTSTALEAMNATYHQALQNRPQDWILHWQYGKFLQGAMQAIPAAMVQFETTQQIAPQFYMAPATLGAIYMEQNASAQATACFEKVLSIKPRAEFAYHNLGLLKQKQQRFTEAEHDFRKAIALSPTYQPSYISLGTLLAQQNRAQEAIKLCRQGLQYLPDSADLHSRLGLCLILVGNNAEAEKQLHQALRLDPNHVLSQQGLKQLQ